MQIRDQEMHSTIQEYAFILDMTKSEIHVNCDKFYEEIGVLFAALI